MSLVHGKPNTYDYHGCRCEDCTTAKREYRRANYQRRRAEGPQCITTGCEKRAGHGPLCPAHEQARIRAGEPAPVGRRPVTGYFAAHRRLRNTRGSASQHQCGNCESQAAEWALDNKAEDIQIQAGGSAEGLAFSADPDDYWALCVSCHRIYDATLRKLAS